MRVWLPLAGLVGQTVGIFLVLDQGRYFWPGDLLLFGGLLASGVYFLRPMEQGLRISLAEFQGIIREKNHAYLNHLQVLSGWSEMGLPVPGAYLERTIQAAVAMRELEAVPYPGLAIALLWARQRAEKAGVAWECRLEGKIAEGKTEAARHLQEVLAGKLERLGKLPDQRRLEVNVEGREGGTMVQIGSFDGGDPSEVETVWLPGG